MANLTGEPASWFYVLDSRRQGPFDRAGLIRELLGVEAPEGVLVWRTGLLAWTKAGLLDELKRELPPPVPGAMDSADAPLALPDLPQAEDREGEPEAREALSDGDFVAAAGGAEGEGPSAAETPRRRRRHRKPRSAGWPSYLLPLILLFLGVMLGLWFLLRRMNEVPPGRIIQQGRVAPPALSSSASGSRRSG